MQGKSYRENADLKIRFKYFLSRHDIKINYLTYFDKRFANILIEKYNLNTNSYQVFERLSNTQEIELVIKSLKLKLFNTDNPNLHFDIFCNDTTVLDGWIYLYDDWQQDMST